MKSSLLPVVAVERIVVVAVEALAGIGSPQTGAPTGLRPRWVLTPSPLVEVVRVVWTATKAQAGQTLGPN